MSAERVEQQVTAEWPGALDEVLDAEEEVKGGQGVGGTLEGVEAGEEEVLAQQTHREDQLTGEEEQAEGQQDRLQAHLQMVRW